MHPQRPHHQHHQHQQRHHQHPHQHDHDHDHEGQQPPQGRAVGNFAPWAPPGTEPEQHPFESDFQPHFHIPARLQGRSAAMVTAVNDFHFAMMNDCDRNAFYRSALTRVVGPDTVVLEIGAGSGLLSMIAARCGAKHVYAVEASVDMVRVAQQCIEANGLQDQITLINLLSTDVELADIGGQPADVLVSEILGTLLLGESALDYVSDAKRRLLSPNAIIIPTLGCQHAQLIECPDVESITRVQGWGGFDLSSFNQLQDTVSCVFSKQYGFRVGSVPYRTLSENIPVIPVDFRVHGPGCVPLERRLRIKAKEAGTVHAVMCSWEVFADAEKSLRMSTHPADTVHNFPRDMQWGQALQLVEEVSDQLVPKKFEVAKDEELDLVVRVSHDSVEIQFVLERVPKSS